MIDSTRKKNVKRSNILQGNCKKFCFHSSKFGVPRPKKLRVSIIQDNTITQGTCPYL